MNRVILEFEDGSKDILLPPPLLARSAGKTIRIHALLKEWHRILIEDLTQQECRLWGPEQDITCYPIAQPYYEKIWKLLGRSLDPSDPQHLDQLLPECRHRLFVGTDPFEQDDKWIIGLSNLEKLLGQQVLTSGQAEEVSGSDRTTGSEELDILTSTVLIFKRKGLELAEIYGADELHKMCKLANQLQTPDDDADTKKSVKAESDAPDPSTELDKLNANKAAIVEGLKQIGVTPPPNF